MASSVDAVLLSHSDTIHLGALPYAMKQFGLNAPVFSTEPVHRLGLLTMYDHYLARRVISIAFLCLNCWFLIYLLFFFYVIFLVAIEVNRVRVLVGN